MIKIYKNGQWVNVDGNLTGVEIVLPSNQTHINELQTLNSYFYSSAISELRIDSFANESADTIKEYRITFKVASNFVFEGISNKTYKFAEGEPVWDTDTIYTLIITKGIDTDYIIYVTRA